MNSMNKFSNLKVFRSTAEINVINDDNSTVREATYNLVEIKRLVDKYRPIIKENPEVDHIDVTSTQYVVLFQYDNDDFPIPYDPTEDGYTYPIHVEIYDRMVFLVLYNKWDDARIEIDVSNCDEGQYQSALYFVTRNYGGPEEGGWWYDCGTPVSVAELTKLNFEQKWFSTKDEAYRYQDSLGDWLKQLNEDCGNRSLSSVLSRGQYQLHVVNGQPRPFPENTPHYE